MFYRYMHWLEDYDIHEILYTVYFTSCWTYNTLSCSYNIPQVIPKDSNTGISSGSRLGLNPVCCNQYYHITTPDTAFGLVSIQKPASQMAIFLTAIAYQSPHSMVIWSIGQICSVMTSYSPYPIFCNQVNILWVAIKKWSCWCDFTFISQQLKKSWSDYKSENGRWTKSSQLVLAMGSGNWAAVWVLSSGSVQFGFRPGQKPHLVCLGGFVTWTGHRPVGIWPGWNCSAVSTLRFRQLWLQLNIWVLFISWHG
jgi:hypothetical protein